MRLGVSLPGPFYASFRVGGRRRSGGLLYFMTIGWIIAMLQLYMLLFKALIYIVAAIVAATVFLYHLIKKENRTS